MRQLLYEAVLLSVCLLLLQQAALAAQALIVPIIDPRAAGGPPKDIAGGVHIGAQAVAGAGQCSGGQRVGAPVQLLLQLADLHASQPLQGWQGHR